LVERHAADGLVVLGVNAWDEPEDMVKRFVREKNLKHRILLDGSEVAERYGIVGLPVILWIDGDGVIVDGALGLTRGKRISDKTTALLKHVE
jgi:hypothetical protein